MKHFMRLSTEFQNKNRISAKQCAQFGTHVAFCVAGDRTAWILPFTAGGFIYIALVSVVPELMKETNWRVDSGHISVLQLGSIAVYG